MPKWILLAALTAAFACERDREPEQRTAPEGAVGAEREEGAQPRDEGQDPGPYGRDQQGPTAQEHGAGEEDLRATQAIRQRLMEADLSTAARNVQVITEDGRVTLRGNVATAQERAEVERLAREAPGVQEVDNQLEVGAR